MKGYKIYSLIGMLLCLLASACSAQGTGPRTWIDLPLDDTTAPLAPLTLMAHSSDVGGVKNIEFFVNGEQIESLNTGGSRLESSRFEWTPIEPGLYTIQARGINNVGKKGPMASAAIKILGPEEQKTPTPEPTEITQTETPSQTPTVTITPSQTHEDTLTPSFTPSWTPTVIIPSDTPKVEIIKPATIELDTTNPVITSVKASPDPIYHQVCGSGFELVVRLTVKATDNVAIDHVGGTWSIGGESGDYILNHIGGSTYQKDFGPFSTLGPLYFVGSAEDTSGNWTYYEAWVTVKNCIE